MCRSRVLQIPPDKRADRAHGGPKRVETRGNEKIDAIQYPTLRNGICLSPPKPLGVFRSIPVARSGHHQHQRAPALKLGFHLNQALLRRNSLSGKQASRYIRQGGKEADKQAGRQAGKAARRQAGRQAGTITITITKKRPQTVPDPLLPTTSTPTGVSSGKGGWNREGCILLGLPSTKRLTHSWLQPLTLPEKNEKFRSIWSTSNSHRDPDRLGKFSG